MQYRPLGSTGINVSALSFGAGPISTLMTGEDRRRQRRVLEHALAVGINWFDTAASYGLGQSESNLGRALEELDAMGGVHVATKVRLKSTDLADIRGAVRSSVRESLQRLRCKQVTLLQLHNSITAQRDDEPTSVTPEDVLGADGIAEAFEELRAAGLVRHLGLTGIGQPAALRTVIASGRFQTLQTPYHLLNPSAGRDMPATFTETNYGNIIAAASAAQMGVMAIRVFAGGALVDRPPSPHTLTTPFFPLSLFERDRARARQWQQRLGPCCRLSHEAVRFALSHGGVATALIGFGEVQEIDDAVAALELDTPPWVGDDVWA